MSLLQQLVKQPQRVWLRRALFQVHLWTGVGIGLYVFVISISGSAIVFRNEVYRDFGLKPVVVEPSGSRMTMAELIAAARRNNPGYDVGLVYANPKEPNQAVEITLERGGRRRPRLFDPYTGKDLGASVPNAIRLASWLADLHVNLLYDRPGRVVNAVGGGLVALLGLTGAVIWWPGIQKWWRSLTIRRTSSWKRFNWDLHSALGFWTLLFVIMWGLTGIFAAVPDPFRDLVDYLQPLPVRPVQAAPREPRPAPAEGGRQDLAEGSRGGARQDATRGDGRGGARGEGQSAVQPGGQPRVQSGGRGDGQRGNPGGQRGRRPAPPQRLGDTILRWAYYLHFGNFAGWKVKVLWVILGLAPPALFVTGILMWWNRVIRPGARQSN